METNYISVKKNDLEFLVNIENNIANNFWKNQFTNWENDTFSTFDKYLQKDKQFLDIGGWIGTTCLYASKKSSKVVVVEADPVSVEILKKNISLNNLNDICFLESNPILNEKRTIFFGPNKIGNHHHLNDSMSQLKFHKTHESDVTKESITLNEIIDKYSLDDLCLIKVDIEGGEEFILDDLYNYASKNKVPLYLSFHYSWWVNKDLNRFKFLTDNQKNLILNRPFISLVFEF